MATRTQCPRCGGINGQHGLVHVRYGNGGGGNKPCPDGPLTIEQARAIGANPYRKRSDVLEKAVDVLTEHGNDESDQYLMDAIWDELGRREDVEPPYDTPSLEDRGVTRPTYGA